MIACLKYGYRCFGNVSGLVLTCLLCCDAPGYHALLVASIPLICLCLLVVHVDVLVMFMLVSMPCLVDMIYC